MRAAVVALILMMSEITAAQTSSGQSAPPSPVDQPPEEQPRVRLVLRDVTRVASWRFFAPAGAEDDASYTMLANRATLGVGVNGTRLDAYGAFQYSQMIGLPRRAEGTDPLGPGGQYFAAAGMPAAYQLYFKALSVRLRARAGNWSIEAGRMGGIEGSIARPVREPQDETRRQRLDGRLIGGAEWSTFERAFDGVRAEITRHDWRAGGALAFPTQGVFEESASPTMEKLRVAAGSLGWHTRAESDGARFDWQAFATHYRDRRSVTSRPDNSLRVAASANVHVSTLGVSHVGVWPAASGRLETLAWSAWQSGDWYEQRHRAWSAMLEGGYEWTSSVMRPRMRAGWLVASGDDDPADEDHRTFFPMLPSSQPDVLDGTFAQMNARQLFAQLRLAPRSRWELSAEIRRLRLASGNDLWYSGSGATAREGRYFGYSGRLAAGATALGTMLQTRVDVTVHPRWRLRGAVAVVHGGDAIRRSFARDRLLVLVVESVLDLSH